MITTEMFEQACETLGPELEGVLKKHLQKVIDDMVRDAELNGEDITEMLGGDTEDVEDSIMDMLPDLFNQLDYRDIVKDCLANVREP